MSDNDATKIPSRFEEAVEKAPTLTGLRASNTLESLKPKEINVEAIKGMFEASGWQNPPELIKEVRKTDNGNLPAGLKANIQKIEHTADGPKWVSDPEASARMDKLAANLLPVNWPASSFTPPSLLDRVIKLEEQVDSILDRLAKFSIRSSHKI